MSWVRIWIHLVFSTKNREPFLNDKNVRLLVFKHIKENAEGKGIFLDCVNGFNDHAHCLISLGRGQTISKIVQQIKGESSMWINRQDLISDYFRWQDDYWAVSISESHLKSVRKYIHNQESHHQKKTFVEEMNVFVRKYNWKAFK